MQNWFCLLLKCVSLLLILLDPRKINPSQPLLLKAQCFCSYRRLAHRNTYKDTVDFHFVIVWNHWPSSLVLFRWNLDVNVTRASVAKIDPVMMFSFICWICWNNNPITNKICKKNQIQEIHFIDFSLIDLRIWKWMVFYSNFHILTLLLYGSWAINYWLYHSPYKKHI